MRRSTRSTLVSVFAVLVMATVPVLVPLLITTRDGRTDGERPRIPPAALSPSPIPPGAPEPTTTASADPPPSAGAMAPPPKRRTHPPTTSRPARPVPVAPAVRPPAPTGTGLVVDRVTWSPGDPADGDEVVFAAVVRNDSPDPVAGLTHGIVFLVDDTTVFWSGTDPAVLAPNETRVYAAEDGVFSTTWTATPGVHTIEAVMDDRDRSPDGAEGADGADGASSTSTSTSTSDSDGAGSSGTTIVSSGDGTVATLTVP